MAANNRQNGQSYHCVEFSFTDVVHMTHAEQAAEIARDGQTRLLVRGSL